MRGLASWGPREVMWIDSLHVDRAAARSLPWPSPRRSPSPPAWCRPCGSSGLGLQTPGHRTMTGDRGATAPPLDAGRRRGRAGADARCRAPACCCAASSTCVNVDAGFRTDGVMVLQMFAWDRNPGPAALRSFFDRVTTRRSPRFPASSRSALVQAMPFIESNIDIQRRGAVARSAGAAAGRGDPRVPINVASPGLLRRHGRAAAARPRLLDAATAPTRRASSVISEALPSAICRNVDPIGQRVEFRANGKPVPGRRSSASSAPLRHERLDEAPRAEMFLIPFAQVADRHR